MGVLPSHPSSSYSAVPRFPPRAGSSERVWGERTAHRLLRPGRLPEATRWGVGLEKRTGERRDERLEAAPTRSGTCPLAVGSLARRAAADPESCEFLGAPPRRYGVKNGGATLEPGRRRGGAGCS